MAKIRNRSCLDRVQALTAAFVGVVILLTSSVLCSAADSELTVAVPYLPERIELISREPITLVILNQIASAPMANVWAANIGAEDNDAPELAFDLANSVQQDDSGTEWQLSLRPGARFPTGSRINADSVAQFYLFLKAHTDAFGFSDPSFIKELDDLEAVEVFSFRIASNRTISTRVVARFRRPLADLPSLFKVPVLNTQVLETDLSREVGQGTYFPGSGPFYLREYRPQLRAVMERVIAPGDTSEVSKITLRVFADSVRALRALRTGGADLILLPSKGQIADVDKDPTLEILPFTVVPLVARSGSESKFELLKKEWKSEERVGGEEVDSSRYIRRKTLSLGKGESRLLFRYAAHTSP